MVEQPVIIVVSFRRNVIVRTLVVDVSKNYESLHAHTLVHHATQTHKTCSTQAPNRTQHLKPAEHGCAPPPKAKQDRCCAMPAPELRWLCGAAAGLLCPVVVCRGSAPSRSKAFLRWESL